MVPRLTCVCFYANAQSITRPARARARAAAVGRARLVSSIPAREGLEETAWEPLLTHALRWDMCLSEPFSVSNGVRQGSVISPHLFAVYLDGLLLELCNSGVDCYWGCSFAGGFSYADDVVLLAPSASVLRIMLNICCTFSVADKLEFNANKTQLICFHAPSVRPIAPTIYFNGTKLSYSDQVVHLGHILTSNLDDTADIMRTV